MTEETAIRIAEALERVARVGEIIVAFGILVACAAILLSGLKH